MVFSYDCKLHLLHEWKWWTLFIYPLAISIFLKECYLGLFLILKISLSVRVWRSSQVVASCEMSFGNTLLQSLGHLSFAVRHPVCLVLLLCCVPL